MKVAAIQMCSCADVMENLRVAGKLIFQAASEGATLVVLPEMFAIMGTDQHDKINVRETFGQGVIQDFLAESAKKNNIWLVGGTIPIASEDNHKIHAACLLFNDKGEQVARYDKKHLFDVVISDKETHQESATTVQGDKVIVVDTPMGRLGLAVCYDIRFPDLFIALMKQNVEIIAIPAAFTVPTGEAHWQLLARARAVDTFSYIIGACQGGIHSSGRCTYGDSLIVDPWGMVIAERQENTPGIIYADIALENVKRIRKAIPIYQHL